MARNSTARDGFSAWFGDHTHLVLAAILLIVAGTWGFIELADEVMEGSTQNFDDWAVQRLRQPSGLPLGPAWLNEIGRDITALGGVAVLCLVTLLVVVYLLMIRKYHAMWLVLIASAGGLLLSTVLKELIDRQRPDVQHFSLVMTSSFPSGHSMLSAVVYLTLGSLLTRLTPHRRVKIYFMGVALLLTFLVGISRVYMGVHYPTDVLAGWSAGLVWAMLCWVVATYLQHRGKVEKDEEMVQDDTPTRRQPNPARPSTEV